MLQNKNRQFYAVYTNNLRKRFFKAFPISNGMKKVLPFLLSIILFSITAFGFFAMGHDGSHGGCLAATAKGASCPENNPLAYVNFHFGALKTFSQAVLDYGISGALILFSLVLSLLVFARSESSQIAALESKRYYRKFLLFSPFPITVATNHWLALHENSPSVI